VMTDVSQKIKLQNNECAGGPSRFAHLAPLQCVNGGR